jgi:hypothetical protein
VGCGPVRSVKTKRKRASSEANGIFEEHQKKCTEVQGDLSALKPEDVSHFTPAPKLTAEVAYFALGRFEVQVGFEAQWFDFGGCEL